MTFGDISQKLQGNSNLNKLVTIGGDMSGNGYPPASITVTLNTVNSNVGTFGSSTQTPVITVNGKGLITAVTTALIPVATAGINLDYYTMFGGV